MVSGLTEIRPADYSKLLLDRKILSDAGRIPHPIGKGGGIPVFRGQDAAVEADRTCREARRDEGERNAGTSGIERGHPALSNFRAVEFRNFPRAHLDEVWLAEARQVAQSEGREISSGQLALHRRAAGKAAKRKPEGGQGEDGTHAGNGVDSGQTAGRKQQQGRVIDTTQAKMFTEITRFFNRVS